jgi:hypothetical protein
MINVWVVGGSFFGVLSNLDAKKLHKYCIYNYLSFYDFLNFRVLKVNFVIFHDFFQNLLRNFFTPTPKSWANLKKLINLGM